MERRREQDERVWRGLWRLWGRVARRLLQAYLGGGGRGEGEIECVWEGADEGGVEVV